MVIFEDNQSAISMARFHGRSKHIAIKYHFIREQVNCGKINLRYCRTNDMNADLHSSQISRYSEALRSR